MVSDTYAYATESGQLLVIDISDPTTPTLAGSYDTGGSATRVVVAGSYAYVTSAEYNRVIDISNPTAPAAPTTGNESLCTVTDTDSCVGISISGGYAFVTICSNGLAVIDISDPATPTLFATRETGTYGTDISVGGSYAYVPTSDSSFEAFQLWKEL